MTDVRDAGMELKYAGKIRCGWIHGHRSCMWFTDDPSGICEEHSQMCESCGRNPCPDNCLGPQNYQCVGCRGRYIRELFAKHDPDLLCRTCNDRAPRKGQF